VRRHLVPAGLEVARHLAGDPRRGRRAAVPAPVALVPPGRLHPPLAVRALRGDPLRPDEVADRELLQFDRPIAHLPAGGDPVPDPECPHPVPEPPGWLEGRTLDDRDAGLDARAVVPIRIVVPVPAPIPATAPVRTVDHLREFEEDVATPAGLRGLADGPVEPVRATVLCVADGAVPEVGVRPLVRDERHPALDRLRVDPVGAGLAGRRVVAPDPVEHRTGGVGDADRLALYPVDGVPHGRVVVVGRGEDAPVVDIALAAPPAPLPVGDSLVRGLEPAVPRGPGADGRERPHQPALVAPRSGQVTRPFAQVACPVDLEVLADGPPRERGDRIGDLVRVAGCDDHPGVRPVVAGHRLAADHLTCHRKCALGAGLRRHRERGVPTGLVRHRWVEPDQGRATDVCATLA
jgi:hypothetical protein